MLLFDEITLIPKKNNSLFSFISVDGRSIQFPDGSISKLSKNHYIGCSGNLPSLSSRRSLPDFVRDTCTWLYVSPHSDSKLRSLILTQYLKFMKEGSVERQLASDTIFNGHSFFRTFPGNNFSPRELQQASRLLLLFLRLVETKSEGGGVEIEKKKGGKYIILECIMKALFFTYLEDLSITNPIVNSFQHYALFRYGINVYQSIEDDINNLPLFREEMNKLTSFVQTKAHQQLIFHMWLHRELWKMNNQLQSSEGKRSILYFGPPGTGKDFTCHLLFSKLKIIHSIDEVHPGHCNVVLHTIWDGDVSKMRKIVDYMAKGGFF